jgi:hypothetical protein
MTDERVQKRAKLEQPYRHPVRHCTAETWRARKELRRVTYAGLATYVVGGVGVAAGVDLLALLGGLGALLLTVAVLAWIVAILREAWRLNRSWGQRSELASVLARRPQAGDEDPDLAHDLFAVTVEDDGRFLTWRFRPLTIDAEPGIDEVEVPGRPRYGARTVEDRIFEVEDAAIAAEQLVEAQERAAEREVNAARAARRAVEAADRSSDLAVEARSTAAALQRTTGQRSRRD